MQKARLRRSDCCCFRESRYFVQFRTFACCAPVVIFLKCKQYNYYCWENARINHAFVNSRRFEFLNCAFLQIK